VKFQAKQLEKKIPILKKGSDGKYILIETEDVNKFVKFALNKAKKLSKSDFGTFFHFNNDCKLNSFDSNIKHSEIYEIVASYCIDHKCKILINPDEPATIPDSLKERLGERSIVSSIIGIYMGLNPGDLGAVIFSDPKYERIFTSEDFELIDNLASTFIILVKNTVLNLDTAEAVLNFKSSVSFLLNNVTLTRKNTKANKQLRSVLEVSNLINSSREITEVIRAVFKSARSVFQAESVSLFLLDRNTGELYFDVISEETARKLQGLRIPIGQGIVGICAQEKKSILVNDAQNDPRIFKDVDKRTGNTTRNLIASPLKLNDEVIGVIEVMNTIDRPFFTGQDVEIFESFSDSVAIAINRRGLLDDLQNANVQLEKKLKETQTLHSISTAILNSYDHISLFNSITSIIHEVLNIGRTAVFVLDSGNQLQLESMSGTELVETSARSELEIATDAINNNEFIILGENYESGYSCFNTGDNKCSTCMILPLQFPSSNSTFGALSLCDFKSSTITHEEIRLINTISSEISRAYENMYLSKQLLEISAIEKEVEITSEIQKNILPAKMPEHCHIEVSAKSIMAKTMGGDFYDYYVHDKNGDITLLVADVSGKSLPAALFMAASSSTLRTIMRTTKNPSKILSAGNKLIYEDSQSGMFVTVFLALYQPAKRILKFSSAGHNEMILMHEDGSFEFLSAKGTPVGALPDFLIKYQEKEITIQTNDTLVLYTDGVVEAINSKQEEFGIDRFLNLLKENISKNPEEIINLTYNSVLDFAGKEIQYDDFTMLVTKFKGTVQGHADYNFKFHVAVESIPVLRDSVRSALEKHGLSGRILDDILLAVDEAGSNITIHAFKDRSPENETFECSIHIDSKEILEIEFTDKGHPFKIEDVKEPDPNENLSGNRKGGFGVYLIRSLMDNVEYEHKDGTNRLKLIKYLNKE